MEDENLEEKFIEAIASNLDETIESKEIEIIHRIGQRLSNQASSGNRKPRPVIVKFVSNKTKTRIFFFWFFVFCFFNQPVFISFTRKKR